MIHYGNQYRSKESYSDSNEYAAPIPTGRTQESLVLLARLLKQGNVKGAQNG